MIKEDLKKIFTNIFNTNHWNSTESVSSPGSEKIQTEKIRRELPNLISKFNIKTIIDAPCGDFNWMNMLNIDKYIEQYCGIDIVDDLIINNNKKYSNNKIKFLCKNLINYKVNKADLILCRECLVHISLNDIKLIINNFISSGSKYLLLTNYSNITFNKDACEGHWRPLNFMLEPFNFPKPIYIIDENYTDDGSYPGKEMALWKIDTLKM